MLENLPHYFASLVNLFLHLDVHLSQVIAQYGHWTYPLLALVVFCETGLVVTPILPGDSLLFAAGTFAASGMPKLWLLWVTLAGAAVAGDGVNYSIGRILGSRVWEAKFRLIRPEYLRRTQDFYERYGGKTIVIARFVPIIRTFAPFLAGVGKMSYPKFASYNVVGGVLWISVCLLGGYLFGNIPFVRHNFSIAILGVVFVSLLPAVFAFYRERAASAGKWEKSLKTL